VVERLAVGDALDVSLIVALDVLLGDVDDVVVTAVSLAAARLK
jgi:hypothetical protein